MSNRNNRDRIACAGRCFEQLVLLALARDLQRQLSRPRPALTVKLAKMSDRLLPDLVAMTHRADKTPVGVRLAVLPNSCVAEVHRPNLAPFSRRGPTRSTGLVVTTRTFAKHARATARLAGDQAREVASRFIQLRKLG